MANPMDLDFQQEKLAKKILKIVEGFIKLTENRDERAFGLLSGLYPPKKLVVNRALLHLKVEAATNPKFKKIVAKLREEHDRLLDYFQRAPIFLESMIKEEAGEDEQEVIIG